MPMRSEAEAEQDCRTTAEEEKEQGVLMPIGRNCPSFPPTSLIQGIAVNIRTEISYKPCDNDMKYRKCKMYDEGKKTF